MNSIRLLNALISIFYFVLLVSAFAFCAYFLYISFSEGGVGLMIDKAKGDVMVSAPNLSDKMGIKDYGYLLLMFLEIVFFIKAIYHLRKATLKMIRNEMFNLTVSSNLKMAGISMIIYMLNKMLCELYKDVIYLGHFSVGFDFSGFDSSIFILILGLFFILFSNVIKNGISLKNENELTI